MLGIERWQVFGGSWGCTLALAYAETHPERVSELVLRGIFLLRKRELDWFYQAGACVPVPDAGRTTSRRSRPRSAATSRARTTGGSRAATPPRPRPPRAPGRCGKARRVTCRPTTRTSRRWGEDAFALAFARIECHYFVNRGFLERESQLLDDVGRIRHIPAVIVQGRYDVVCPMVTAWDLHRAWPEAELQVIGDAGHSAFEPGITDALVRATDRFAS